MSTLTKIFVILLVVFSIAFSMSAISFVAQTNEWKSLAQTRHDQFTVADTTVRNLIAAQAAEKAAWVDAANGQRTAIADLQKQAMAARDGLAEAETELAALRSKNLGMDAAVVKLTHELSVSQDGWKEARAQRDRLEEEKIELEKRNIDLNERVNETTARIVVLTQQNRQAEQQINILRGENQKISQQSFRAPLPGAETTAGGSMDTVTPVSPVAASAIRGRVLEVQGNLVSISVGSSDGVQKDMVFVVYRDNDYIGDLRVTEVAPNRSAGRLIRSEGAARVNDMVADEARFGLAK